jgi:hypothetical protein
LSPPHTLVTFETCRTAPDDLDSRPAAHALRYRVAKFARAFQHVGCGAGEKDTELTNRCLLAATIKRPLRSTQNNTSAESFEPWCSKVNSALDALLNCFP